VLAVINIRDERFELYDAMPATKKSESSFEREVFRNLRRWIQDESNDKHGIDFDLTRWTDHGPWDIPHQQNGFDCGMFAVKYSQCVALDLPLEELPFGQEHMEQFRQRAILEMLDASTWWDKEAVQIGEGSDTDEELQDGDPDAWLRARLKVGRTSSRPCKRPRMTR
jgi:Ulp1 family protease